MVNEVLADVLYESAKAKGTDKHYDTKQLFYRLQLAPKEVDFPTLVEVVELLEAQANTAKYCCNPEYSERLENCELLFCQIYKYEICATSSEGGKLMRLLHTQSSEYTGKWEGSEKSKGVQGFFKQMGQKQVA